MGFHIIIAIDSKLETYYINNIRDLSTIDDLHDNALIYEGPRSLTPIVFKNFEPAKDFREKKARIGALAEDLFKNQAINHAFAVQKYDQSQEGFQQYKKTIRNAKRPDFIIVNASVDVEVKCIKFYDEIKKDRFYLEISEIERLSKFYSHSKRPIIFAIYHQDNSKPEADSLRMIELNVIIEKNKEEPFVIEDGRSYIIPLNLTSPGFKLLEPYKTIP